MADTATKVVVDAYHMVIDYWRDYGHGFPFLVVKWLWFALMWPVILCSILIDVERFLYWEGPVNESAKTWSGKCILFFLMHKICPVPCFIFANMIIWNVLSFLVGLRWYKLPEGLVNSKSYMVENTITISFLIRPRLKTLGF